MSNVPHLNEGANPTRRRPLPPAGSIDSYINQHLRLRGTQGAEANTIATYRIALEQFATFLEGRDITLVQHVDQVDVEEFLAALVEAGRSGRTAELKLRAVKQFLAFAVSRGVIKRNPAEKVRRPQWRRQRVVAPEEAKILEMLAAIPAEKTEDIRDRALFSLMYDAALRDDGVICLDVVSGSTAPQYCVETMAGLVHYRGKGGATKTAVFTSQETAERLMAWFEVRHRFARTDECPALFLSRLGGRLTNSAIIQRIKKHGARVGLPSIHPHLPRHRRLGEVMEKAGPQAAQSLAAHSDMSTTMNMYGAHAQERLRHQIRTMAPVGAAAGEGAGC